MPDQRTNQQVAERLDIRLERYPNPLHRRRRWFTWAGGLLPLLLLGIYFARGDHSIFMSRPVAASHQHFQEDCQTCHHAPWQPLLRLVTADASVRSVGDADCQQCHMQNKADHNILAMARGVPDCAACHREHRGRIRLTDQADTACVKCHEPFENHPQFGLLRRWPLEHQTNASSENRAEQLAQFAALVPDPAAASPPSARWVDQTALKFSHADHLDPKRANLIRGRDGLPSSDAAPLTCADCHELDANGQYMRPIVYEDHCRNCHPLRFSGKLDVAGLADPDDHAHQLPHEAPEIVLSVMRQRLAANAPRYLEQADPPDASTSRLPNRRSTQERRQWEWVAEELRVLQNAIFRPRPGDDPTVTGNVCLKCHVSDAAPEPRTPAHAAATGFSIAPPNIPTRWLPNGRFRHDRHLNLQCVACHDVGDERALNPPSLSSAAAPGDASVQVIRMPDIETCQRCHGATGGGGPDWRPARRNCTECHQYHHHDFSTQAAHERAAK